LQAKTGTYEDGVSGSGERGTAVVSSFCCGVMVLEWEVEDSGRMGIEVVRIKLARDMELTVLAKVSV